MAPSWKVAAGLFALTLGSLTLLVGVIFYTWGQLHTLYGVPFVLVPAVGFLVLAVGGAMVLSERSESLRRDPGSRAP